MFLGKNASTRLKLRVVSLCGTTLRLSPGFTTCTVRVQIQGHNDEYKLKVRIIEMENPFGDASRAVRTWRLGPAGTTDAIDYEREPGLVIVASVARAGRVPE